MSSPIVCTPKRSLGLLVGVAYSLVPLPTHAGPPEYMAEVVLSDSDPCRMTVRYIHGRDGLLFSNDGGRSFRLRCSSSMDEEDRVGSNFTVAFGADGAPLVGSFAGLSEAEPSACGWGLNPDPLVAARVVDFAPHPTDDSVSFILVSSTSQGERTGIVTRNADGTLSAVGKSDTGADGNSEFYGSSLHVVEREGAVGGVRYYETGSRRDADFNITSYVRYSDDGAETWVEHEVPDTGSGTLLLWGIDPTDSSRLLLSVRDPEGAGTPDRVLVTDDAGETVRSFIDEAVSEVSGAVIAKDGKVWLADAGNIEVGPLSPKGLWFSDSLTQTPTKLVEEGIHCLTMRPQDGTLFGCHLTEFGRLDPATGAFTPTFTFRHAEGFVECPGEALAETCQSQLCDAYCGPLHYAESQLCTAYSEPNCGPEAAEYSGGSTQVEPLAPIEDPLCPVEEQPSAGDAGAAIEDASVPPAPSGSDAGSAADASTGSGPVDPPEASGEGGGCTSAGPHASSCMMGWLGILGVALLRRRRITGSA